MTCTLAKRFREVQLSSRLCNGNYEERVDEELERVRRALMKTFIYADFLACVTLDLKRAAILTCFSITKSDKMMTRK